MLLYLFFTKTFSEKVFMLDYQQIIKYRIQKTWETYNASKVLIDAKLLFFYLPNKSYLYSPCFWTP